MKLTYHVVLVYRGDGKYRLLDTIGAKAYRRASAAQTRADGLNHCDHAMTVNPSGYVVRSTDYYVDMTGCVIAPSGAIRVSA